MSGEVVSHLETSNLSEGETAKIMSRCKCSVRRSLSEVLRLAGREGDLALELPVGDVVAIQVLDQAPVTAAV